MLYHTLCKFSPGSSGHTALPRGLRSATAGPGDLQRRSKRAEDRDLDEVEEDQLGICPGQVFAMTVIYKY